MTRLTVVALVGATATGKTALGEALAATLGGEIVCGDSRQVFRELERGTGKPTPAERAALPHHLFDAWALGERVSAGAWAAAAAAACAAIHARGRVPVVVGGSGLYLRALQHGLAHEPPHDAARRARLTAEARAHGTPALHARLREVDPELAARLAPHDTQRVTRGLEVWEASGRPLSWWHREQPARGLDATWHTIELTLPAATTARRIERRTRAMFDEGLVEEVRDLVARGHAAALQTLRAVGYDECMALLDSRITRDQAESETNRRTRLLAKRQRTWFRHQIEAQPLDADQDMERLLEQATAITTPT